MLGCWYLITIRWLEVQIAIDHRLVATPLTELSMTHKQYVCILTWVSLCIIVSEMHCTDMPQCESNTHSRRWWHNNILFQWRLYYFRFADWVNPTIFLLLKSIVVLYYNFMLICFHNCFPSRCSRFIKPRLDLSCNTTLHLQREDESIWLPTA